MRAVMLLRTSLKFHVGGRAEVPDRGAPLKHSNALFTLSWLRHERSHCVSGPADRGARGQCHHSVTCVLSRGEGGQRGSRWNGRVSHCWRAHHQGVPPPTPLSTAGTAGSERHTHLPDGDQQEGKRKQTQLLPRARESDFHRREGQGRHPQEDANPGRQAGSGDCLCRLRGGSRETRQQLRGPGGPGPRSWSPRRRTRAQANAHN